MQCEVLLLNRWSMEKGAVTFHKRVVNKEFHVYEVQSSEAILTALGLQHVDDGAFGGLRAKVEEVPERSPRTRLGDYVLTFMYDSKNKNRNTVKSTAPLYFRLPDVFTWQTFNATKKDFEKALRASNLTFDDLENESFQNLDLGTRLNTFGDIEAYILASHLESEDIYGLEIGGYFPCQHPLLRKVVEKHRVRTETGWRCAVPLLRFATSSDIYFKN